MTAIAILSSVMPALVAGIHALRHRAKKDVDGRGFMREDGASRLSPSHDDRDQKALTKSCPTAANLQGHGFAAFKLTRMFCLGPRSRSYSRPHSGFSATPIPIRSDPACSRFSRSGRP